MLWLKCRQSASGTVIKTTQRLRLFSTAIALQNMHSVEYRRSFLEDQGINDREARKISFWAADKLPKVPCPEFRQDFKRATVWLLTLPEFSELAIQSGPGDDVGRWGLSELSAALGSPSKWSSFVDHIPTVGRQDFGRQRDDSSGEKAAYWNQQNETGQLKALGFEKASGT